MIRILYFTLLLFLFTLNIYAKTLKIAINTDMRPYTFINSNKQADGMFVDYWRLWAQKTNTNIEFIPSSWQDSLKAIKNKTVDIHAGLYKSSSREKNMVFLNKIYTTNSRIYINIKNIKRYKKIKDLNNRTIGIINGNYYKKFLNDNYPLIQIKRYSTYASIIKDIENEKLDSLLSDEIILWTNFLKKENKTKQIKNFKLNNSFRAAIIKDDLLLKKLVSKGMSLISKNEIANLENKWIIKKDFRYLNRKFSLNKKEINFLKNNNNIKFAMSEGWNKYSFLDNNKIMRGYHVDLLKLINNKLNTNFKIKSFPSWKESFESVKNEEVAGIFGLSMSKKRDKYFDYSLSYYYTPYFIVVKNSENSINSIKDFSGKTAMAFINSITNTAIKRLSSNTNIVHAKTRKNILKSIQNGTVDTSLFSNISKAEVNKYNLKISNKVYIKEGAFHIGFSKNQKTLINIINKTLSSFTKSEMDILKNKWFNEGTKNSLFSKEELDYIKNSKKLTFGVIEWNPVIFVDENNKAQGISSDILKKISNISGLKFIKYEDTWNNLLNKIRNKTLDIMPATMITKKREKHGLFTQEYLSNRAALFVKTDDIYISSLKNLTNGKLAIYGGSAFIDEIKTKYPLIEIIEVETIEEAFMKIQKGEVNAFLSFALTTLYQINKNDIDYIRTVYLNNIHDIGLRIYSKKDDILLNSILSKSLYEISQNEINDIISKWTKIKGIKKDVKIALINGKEPFTINNGYVNGIEYDLIKKILEKSDIRIKSVSRIYTPNVIETMRKDNEIDIISAVKKKNDNFYYSDDLVSFQNVVISRLKDKLYIKNVNDLKDKSIISFKDSYKYLGKDFYNLFNPKANKPKYKEYLNQEKQIKDFLDNKVDVIILDKNIFKWYLKKISDRDISDFKHDFIFSGVNPYQVVFRDKNLRDVFNKNLELIIKNGEYENIIYDYVNSDINEKVKFASLISTLIAKTVFDNDDKELKKIAQIIRKLPFIDGFEVIKETKNDAIYVNKKINSEKFFSQDSYYTISGVPQKVGLIKIYFNEKKLKEEIAKENVIPALNKFKQLYSFSYIKKIYNNFNLINKKIKFTKEEISYMQNNNIITFSSPIFTPIIDYKDSHFKGIISEYIKEIENKTGLNIVFTPSSSIAETTKAYFEKKYDLFPFLTLHKKKYELDAYPLSYKNRNIENVVSNILTTHNISIITKKNNVIMQKLSDLSGKTIALTKGYALYNYIKNNKLDIKIIETNNFEESLNLVELGKVDASAAFFESAVYSINNNHQNLKISGVFDLKFDLRLIVQKDNKILISIINKVLKTITPSKREEFRKKWINTEVREVINYTVIYNILIVFFLILIVILYFMRKLSNAKNKIEEQKNNFKVLLEDSNDSIILIKNYKYIFANSSALNMFEINKFDPLSSLNIGDLSPKYQIDGMESIVKLKLYIKKCLEDGTVRFEWLFLLKNKNLWADVVFTKIIQNDDFVIHSVSRDITEKKYLETEVRNKSLDLQIQNDEIIKFNKELKTNFEILKEAQNKLIESEKMASLGSLVAGISHEINTPVGIGLTGISHFLEISKNLQKKYDEDEMSEDDFTSYLKTSNELAVLIYSNLKKAASLVNSFKQVAVDQSSEEKRFFDLKEYLNEILISIHSVTVKRKIKIEVFCEKNIKINSYAGSYSQIITNLIMNSLTHAFKKDEKGVITITVVKYEEELRIIYKDSGCGIKKENLSKIFDPFYTTNRDNGGSGLGLSVIYNIVTSKLNGNIRCTSIPDYGIEFTIVINTKE